MAFRVMACEHAAAKYAVENWHYSRRMPSVVRARYAVVEDGSFRGVVLYGNLISHNAGKRYGLDVGHSLELQRVALINHQTPVSQILAVSLRLLRKDISDCKLVLSFADPVQGHHGGIYQAGGWFYLGLSAREPVFWINGRWVHGRTRAHLGLSTRRDRIMMPGKHRYAYPLDKEVKKRLQDLSLPYPRRARIHADEALMVERQSIRVGGSGSNPTHPLVDDRTN